MELLERFALGETDAFEALFREFQREVHGWIVRIVRDGDTAEDLTVEAFWRMYRAHARFDPWHKSRTRGFRERQATPEPGRWDAHSESDPDGSFGAWARRIATNLALDHLKKMRRELPLLIEPVEQTSASPVAQRELREQIDRAFRELSPKLRVVATLALIEDVAYEQIAEALGISMVTVRVRVFRAVRILREQLAGSLPIASEMAGKISHRATEAQRE